MAESEFRPSPFFDPGLKASPDSLALVHLRRDQLMPLILQSNTDETDGYAEGAVINTRFGSFPHSTLLDAAWGSQVRASKVDTGSRGRNKKRKIEEVTSEQSESQGPPKAAEQAGTGFVHILPPTPETWTISLPHRTQVVYNPDYSYILQRLQVRPGQTIIEAGGGSGSFTHAAARAVFNGYSSHPDSIGQPSKKKRKFGRVCTYEYHEPRALDVQREIKDHALDDVVRVTHRDVYEGGFLLDTTDSKQESPCADAIFLDLPAPWMALKNLTRQALSAKTAKIVADSEKAQSADSLAKDMDTALPRNSTTPTTFVSPLNPDSAIHLCTFSPCIEQVTATVAAMRRLGWTEIEMVEVMHKRIDVRRERIGLHEEGLRGVNASAASVDEAVGRLRDVEGKFKEWHEQTRRPPQQANGDSASETGANKKSGQDSSTNPLDSTEHESRQARLDRIKRELGHRKIFKEGRLVHRTEGEIKTHTSYLTFAVLPREWSDEQEEACRRKWPVHGKVTTDYESNKDKKSKKQAQHQKE